MTTARFAIVLSVSDSPNAMVRKVLRRADSDRAVSYAETWLKRSRISGYYFTIWYDQWAVFQVTEDGEEVYITSGNALDSEKERMSRVGQKPKPKKAAKKRALSAPGRVRQATPLKGTLFRRLPPQLVPRKPALAKHTPQSASTRDRLTALFDRARRELADRERIPPMGSNQDS